MRLRIAEFLRRWVRHEDLAKLQSRAVFGCFLVNAHISLISL
jgi:hypothetical protein